MSKIQIKKIEGKINDAFAFLETDFKMSVKENVQSSYMVRRYSWKEERIAIEIEFDFRERDIFVLFVSLAKDGSVPDGYYAANGNICRMHLEKLLPTDEVQILTNEKDRTQQNLEQKVLTYSTLVKKYLFDILKNFRG